MLTFVGTGRSAREIADELGISARTVQRHKESVQSKLGAQNQAEAIATALDLGLIDAVM